MQESKSSLETDYVMKSIGGGRDTGGGERGQAFLDHSNIYIYIYPKLTKLKINTLPSIT